MFVSSPTSESKSRSLRLIPFGGGDFGFDAVEMRESAGEARPLLGCVAVDKVRTEEGRGGGGGRMVVLFPGTALVRCIVNSCTTVNECDKRCSILKCAFN